MGCRQSRNGAPPRKRGRRRTCRRRVLFATQRLPRPRSPMTPDLARGRWQLRAVTAGGAALLLTPAVFTLVYAGRSPGAGAAVGPAIFVAMGLLLARGHAWLRWPLSV